ncbi:hypothetical protein ACFYS8_13340 [Kitasatospora sp. NPDC004615]|uniref:hypothetical protein n=1 Tax=unclassified Kitasatospora TaxID=2633591 RepID=UPI003685BDBA
MTPEQTLTAAAAKLRSLATAAHATAPGPWSTRPSYRRPHLSHPEDATGRRLAHEGAVSTRGGAPWIYTDVSAYLALMHPAVGLAVASLLAEEADSVAQDGGVVQNSTTEAALAIARAILGEQP